MAGIKGKQIANEAISDSKFEANTLTSAKIANDSIDGTKLADDIADSTNYVDTSIDGVHLSSDALNRAYNEYIQCFTLRIDAVNAGTGTSVDVTDSVFSAMRVQAGIESMAKNGSLSQRGIITSAPGNYCHLVLDADNTQYLNGSSVPVYGRLTETLTAKTGTITFTNLSTAVTGSGTLFTTELTPGDYITDGGNYVGRVAVITDDTNLVLDDAWQDVTNSASYSEIQIDLEFYTKSGGSDVAHTGASEVLDVLFNAGIDFNDLAFGTFLSNLAGNPSFSGSHNHDDLYFTETELGATGASDGASLIGYDPSSNPTTSATNIAGALDDLGTAIGSPSGNFVIDDLTPVSAVAPGNTLGNLSNTPGDVTEVVLFVEGIKQREGASNDFTVSGTTVTWTGNATFTIQSTDRVEAHYFV